MQTVVNERFVAGRVKRGNIFSFASLALLVVGFIFSFMGQTLGPESIWLAYGAMLAALALLSFSRPLLRHYGPNFRQDGLLKLHLKGLDQRHTLFNYASSELPDHVLVGPTGLYVLVPKSQGGRIRFDGQRWSRGSGPGALLRAISDGGLGNPMIEVRQALGQLAAYLRKHGTEELIAGLEAKPIVVFTNAGAHLEVRNAPTSVIAARDLKSVFRRAKPTLSQEKVDELRSVLGREVGE